MKMIILLTIQILSCMLADWKVPETIFLILASILWLSVFKYVLTKVKENSKRVVVDKSNAYVFFAGVCAVINPLACFLSVLIYPLWVLNKTLKFASVYWIDKRNKSLSSDSKIVKDDDGPLFRALPYSNSPEEGALIDPQRTYSLDTACNVNEIGRTFESADNYEVASSSMAHDINPASGLPMIGNVDVEGNAYGVDRHY
ncbi:hypothetical protein RRS04_004934 [Klebsiella aerogenes]|nr:hypothetical protein [Klebsiella aerogenes]